jgi:transcriptional activator SPT8
MPAFDDDDDRDLPGSQDASSDDDADETMRDVDDGDGDGEGDADPDADLDADGDDGEGDDDDDAESGSQNSDNEEVAGEAEITTTQDLTLQSTAEEVEAVRGAAMRSIVRPEMLTATTYDIVPTIAAPQSTSVNAICATFDTRWVFSGGSDGYIRKFNWVDSVNNKLALTVAQRHPFVDSVVKAGVMMTYWENWDARSRLGGPAETNQVLSPVYSLACHSQGLWLLSGTASGAIRLQAVRHEEGREIALLQKHTSAVSVLTLASDERSLLSGSWDKTVLDWDLETGKVKTAYAASASQISCIASRPISSVPVPAESGELIVNGTSNSRTQPDAMPNGINSRAQSQAPVDQPERTSPDSLFGDGADDDLFGDSAPGVMTNGGDLGDAFGEDDVEMNPPLADDAPQTDTTDQVNASNGEELQPIQPPLPEPAHQQQDSDGAANGVPNTAEQPLANGILHDDEFEDGADPVAIERQENAPLTSDSTFMATSIDGAIRVWDRRQPNPIARILPQNTPPWCMSACWSPDGNYIYAGRRNNMVQEYDLRGGLRRPARDFKFPNGSGAVTSVRAMPNSRHIIW